MKPHADVGPRYGSRMAHDPIQLWYRADCSKCREAERLILQRDVPVERRDFLDVRDVCDAYIRLLDLAQRTRRQGGRLCFVNEHGESADVVF